MSNPGKVLYQTKEGPLTQREYEGLLDEIHDKKDYLDMEKALNFLNSEGKLETTSLTKREVTQVLELIVFNTIGVNRN